MPVSVSTAGISLTPSPYGHSPNLICDEQRERNPNFCHLHCQYFLTPPSLRDTSPIFCVAKHRGGGRGHISYFYNQTSFLYNEIKQYNLLPCVPRSITGSYISNIGETPKKQQFRGEGLKR